MARSRNRTILPGAHGEGEVGACTMEWVYLIRYGYVGRNARGIRVDWARAEKEDMPPCTCPVISRAVAKINDTVAQRDRDRLADLIPRLLRARPGRTEIETKEMNLRLFLRAMRLLLGDQLAARLREMEDRLVLRREGNLKVTGDESQAERVLWSIGFEVDQHVRDLKGMERGDPERYDSDELINNTVAIHGLFDGNASPDLDGVQFLDRLLDEHEKVLAEMGLMDRDPEDDYLDDETLAELIGELRCR